MIELRPITFAAASDFIAKHHRHHKPAQGWLFGVSAWQDGECVGVACVGRPVARMRQDGFTAEVTRLCTIDLPHCGPHAGCVASKLYAACWRAVKAMGYRRLGTYLLASEPGTSVKAAGWRLVGEAGGGSWSRENRERDDKHPLERKALWEAA